MAAPQGSIAMVPSRCTAETQTSRAKVAFEIADYSHLKGLGRDKCLHSSAFFIGDYKWCIRYYPDGSAYEATEGYMSVFLVLLTKNAEVRVVYTLMLVNRVSGQSIVVPSGKAPRVFNPKMPAWGLQKFMKTTAEVESVYVWNDCLVIECEVSVIKETLNIHVPPSDLSDNLATLLVGKIGADVSFKVQGEVFPAHKNLLAMRWAVFNAEFYGPMGDKGVQDIIIDDMQPAVFKAFLHFIYTDSMPSMDDLEDDDKREMVKHLLVAADKYAMEMMKMICEEMLGRGLDVETVATMLALADQYHCSNLKDACIEFMLSSNRMDDVIASQGYAHLKRSCPVLVVDVFERTVKSRKT
ncbi:BTB/POZ and MATH domain-containing protein 2-like [Triticum dicoccoides]|uniref:BTB/POZ and MATH domain-containing protein 2-like n=1 Tax=Triticum dicoccoides TaxID=85692 RepID=UPI000E7A9517|nr:BTB/POZ and MATH domain-containing protein 2-like [Triticum dicoccoides]